MLRILILVLALFGLPALAQQEVEVIPLRHQTVDRVLPVLQPLLEPGGTLSGMNNQLFLRASRRNRDEIRKALAAIDIPLRKLMIQVTSNREAGRQGAGASGQVVVGGRSEANARVWDSRSASSAGGSQMVQTVEGGRAYIRVGRSLPVTLRQVVIGPGGVVASETVVYRDIGQGFYAEPHVNGNRVTLEISQQADTPGRYGAGSADVQHLSATVSGFLGEWMELGGSGEQASGSERSGFSLSTGELREARSVWIKVEEIAGRP